MFDLRLFDFYANFISKYNIVKARISFQLLPYSVESSIRMSRPLLLVIVVTVVVVVKVDEAVPLLEKFVVNGKAVGLLLETMGVDWGFVIVPLIGVVVVLVMLERSVAVVLLGRDVVVDAFVLLVLLDSSVFVVADALLLLELLVRIVVIEAFEVLILFGRNVVVVDDETLVLLEGLGKRVVAVVSELLG